MSCWSPAVAALLAALALILVLNSEGTEAKRGCSSFGHSCYGGLGKRGEVVGNEELLQDVQEDNPEIVFTGPRSEQHEPRFPPIYNLSPFLRQWLRLSRNLNAERHTENNM